MTLAERLRHAIAVSGHNRTVEIDGDDRGVPFAGDLTWRPAAVLMAVTDRPEPGVLLTVRDSGLRSHAGQVAFPGGRIDPGDDGPVAAALREAEEEIALHPSKVEVAGMLDRYRTGSGFDITPVIGVVPPDLDLSPHPGEVSAIFEPPFALLMDPASFASRSVEWEGSERQYYELVWEDHRIWGATAALFVNIGRRLAGLL